MRLSNRRTVLGRVAGGVLALLGLTLAFRHPALAESAPQVDALRGRIPEVFALAASQYRLLAESLKGQTNLPRTFEAGKLRTVAPKDWTSGFFAGALWFVFEHTQDPKWEAAAREFTGRVESVQHYAGSHDLGFMLNCSYGNGYRLTRDPHYREVLLQGARTLSTRYHPEVGLIRSWDHGNWRYPVIIDNLMNLELLLWAAREAHEAPLRDIALRHADHTLINHFRADASSWHVVDYNPTNGAIMKKQTHQGAADDSAWARGQAWALYGYTMMHRETGRAEYRDQAVKVADFIRHHPRLPTDKIPYWDFDAPNIPNAPRDASAAAIMASALLELGDYVEPDLGRQYRQLAREQLLALTSASYLARPGENGGFLLRHGVGNQPKHSEVDTPLIYADYYLLEALLRYERLMVHGRVFPPAATPQRQPGIQDAAAP